MNWEIIYSWDGFRWTRFQREPQFLDNGPFGHWTHGGNYLNANAFEHNGKVYQSMRWMGNFYHFMAEFVHTDTMSLDHVDAKYMESIYKPRKLERWPYFHKYFDGSWEKLAEYARNSISAIGILEYRKDSYFFMTANDEEAQAVTVPVQAEKSMSINTQVRDGGYLKVTLLDEDDQVIPGYEKEYGTIDDTGLVVFENLPQGKFKVKLDFKNADIYSLMF